MRARVSTLQARLLPHGPLDALRQVALFGIAYYAYALVRGAIRGPTSTAIAFEHGRQLISIEQSLHVFVEPAINTWASGSSVLIGICSWFYLNAQLTVAIGGLVYLYLRHNDRFYFVRNMFLVAMGVALIGYVVFPTAPPRFYPEWGFVDSIANFTGVSHDNQAVNAVFNPYAAVPSMHVAFSLMIGISLSRVVKRRSVKAFWLAYPAIMTFVIVATANHFISDAVLGAATAGFAAYTATWLARARPNAWAFGRERDTVRA